MLQAAGYAATGIDPEAPDGPWYRRIEFERYPVPEPASAIVACTSLHHVADLGEVLGLAEAALLPAGVLVVVEWAWERFDESTARWCFSRLPEAADEHDWLGDSRAAWQASGLPWDAYCQGWAEEEGLHTGKDMLAELEARFDTRELSFGPYFFPGLAATSEADEQSAIHAGQIQANRIQFSGTRREAHGAARSLPADLECSEVPPGE
jgi:SAM-dependent methyltransferase